MRAVITMAAVATALTGPALANGERNAAEFPMDVPVFVEEAKAAGLVHSYDGGWEHFVGGGVASFDCNGDRRPDLAIAGGDRPAAVFVNDSPTGGALKFSQKSDALPASTGRGTIGFYPLDIDQDGMTDLVSLRVGENLLLRGGANCTFEDFGTALSFDGGEAWTTAFAATFEAGAAHPTLAFGNYVDRYAPGSPWGTCHDNVLIRPRTENGAVLYDEQTALSPGHCALSMIFTDWNRSGEPALRLTNDRQYYRGGEEQLWRVPSGRTPSPYRASDGWKRVQIWGMGIAEADLDADGFPEYALTSMGDTKLQTRDAEADEITPAYRDIALERGATAHRPYVGDDLKPSTGWHAQFEDVNNDGLLDLFIAKGNVEAMPDFAAFDPDNILLGTHDGTFVEAGEMAGIAFPTRGRGAAIADFNMDGMLDLVVVNRGEPVSLFRNIGGRHGTETRPMGNWLQVELQNGRTNRTAIGATIIVKSGNETRSRKVKSGGGHASGQAGFIHVGTGVAERAEIRVQWPDGEWSQPYRVFANNFVVIRRGAAEANYWYPPAPDQN